MNKEEILKKLKKINYPGFNRDIVSFGMVKDIVFKDDILIISLNISSQNEEKKQIIIDQIKSSLSNTYKDIVVKIEESSSSPQIQAPSANNPPVAPILENVKHIIAIASGKGGVGKSTVAANVACGLQSQGFKVGLLDLDIYGPSLPITFNINEQPKMTENQKLIPLQKYGIKLMSFGFISGNDTPAIWRGPLVSRMTEQFFKDVDWGVLAYLILDLPPGTGDIQLTLTQKLRMSGAVIVTTPQDIALADVRKGADMFSKVKTPVLGVIENMSGLLISGSLDGNFDQGSKIRFSDGTSVKIENDGSFSYRMNIFKKDGGKNESQRLGVPLLGEIPISEQIMNATDKGSPIVNSKDSSFSKIYLDIVNNLIESLK